MRVIPVGPDASLVELAPGEGLPADTAAWLRSRLAVADVVPAAATVLVDGAGPALVAETLAGFEPRVGPSSVREVRVDVRFDGPDLPEAARSAGLSSAEVVDLITSAELVVAFSGFAPGFGYLTGLPAALHLPRRATPRPRVPAGSVAIAGEYAGIYPTASPGGWHLLGTTDAVLWDVARPEPALLVPGTRVRLVAR